MSSSAKLSRPSLREVRVRHAGGLVHLTFHRVTFDLHYRDAMQIAQWIRLHVKEAKRKTGERSVFAVGKSIDSEEPFVQTMRLAELGADEMRQPLAQQTGVTVMDIDERVAIRIGRCAYAMHFTDAFDLYTAIRVHAVAAKRDVGDQSRMMLTAGVLSDAEQNYKRGI